MFGCEGSTNAVIPALDWALDPNGDGDFSDHLDIVNMSLGSDYGPVDDPENAVVDELTAHGVLSVISMGNNGDLTDTGGAPGNAVSSLAVASSVDALPAARRPEGQRPGRRRRHRRRPVLGRLRLAGQRPDGQPVDR